MASKYDKMENIEIIPKKNGKICESNNNIIYILGLIIKRTSSETTLSSQNNKDIDEIKIIKNKTYLKLLNSANSFNYYLSSKNLIIKNIFTKLLDIYNKDKKHQLLNKEISYGSKEKNNYEKSIKQNEIKKAKNTNNFKKNISKNKKSKDNNILKNKKGKVICKNKENNNEFYGQNYNIKSIMRENPPILPDLFSKVFNLSQKDTLFKDNESFGILNKDSIPNIFYNHFIISENIKG